MNQRMENTNSIVELSDETLEQVIGGSGGGCSWGDSGADGNWGSNGGDNGGDNGGNCGCNRRHHGSRRELGIVGDILGDVFELL